MVFNRLSLLFALVHHRIPGRGIGNSLSLDLFRHFAPANLRLSYRFRLERISEMCRFRSGFNIFSDDGDSYRSPRHGRDLYLHRSEFPRFFAFRGHLWVIFVRAPLTHWPDTSTSFTGRIGLALRVLLAFIRSHTAPRGWNGRS